jgi:WD40 repeat protein
MKKRTFRSRAHGLIAIALLLPFLLNVGNVLAQENTSSGTSEEITPENIQNLELLHWFGQGAFSGSLAQQAGGNLMAAITTSGVALLDRESGEQTGFIPIGLEPNALSISPDGSTLAIVVNYPTGELDGFMGLPAYNPQIQLYTLPEGTQKAEVIQDLGECADSNIEDIAFTPDGAELVFEKKYSIQTDDKKFCLASLAEGKVTRTLDMSENAIMAISPKGDYVAAIEKQSDKVLIYATSDFNLVRELSIPVTDWPELIFSHSGRSIAVRTLTADDQETYSIRIWNLEDGKEIYSGKPALEYSDEMGQNDMITTFEITEDQETVYLGTYFGYVAMLDVKTGELEKQLGPFTWTSYGLTGNPGGVTSYETSATIKTILLSPDEKMLIASEDLTIYGQSGSIHIFQMPAGKEVSVFSGSSAGSESLGIAFSPDSSQIALAGSRDGKVEIYNTGDGQVVMELEGHTLVVNQVMFSPDSKIIATCSDDTTIRLWDAQTGSPIRTLSGHQGRVNRIVFSPDSSWLLSGADDNTLRRWNVVDGKLIETLELGNENWRVDFLDIMNDNASVIYRISKYPSPYIGYIQKQMLWNTQTGDSKAIGGSNTYYITQLASGKELFSGYSYDSGRIVGTLQADGSMAITSSFNSPYGNGALSLPAIAPNHQLVISGNGFGLHAWKLSGNALNFLGLVAADQSVPSYGNEYLFSPDGKYLAYTSGGVAYLMGVKAE